MQTTRGAGVAQGIVVDHAGERSRHGLRVERVDQEPVAQPTDDVVGTAMGGGDDRQTGGRRFQKGQAERFVEGDVGEHAARAAGMGVDGGNVGLLVMARHGHVAVEAVTVAQVEQFLENGTMLRLFRADVLARAGDDDQVRPVAQVAAGEGFHEAGQVLLPNRPGDRQHDRQVGPRERAFDEGAKRWAHVVVGKRGKVAAGRVQQDRSATRAGPHGGIKAVLPFRLVARRHDDAVGFRQDAVLRRDAAGKRRVRFTHGLRLDAAQRVPGEHEGQAQTALELQGDRARVGVVRVDHVRTAGGGDVIDEVGHDGRDLGSHLLLGAVAGRGARHAHDARAFAQGFEALAVAFPENGVVEAAHHDFLTRDARFLARGDEFEQVFDVAARVRRQAVGHRSGTEAPLQCDVHDVHAPATRKRGGGFRMRIGKFRLFRDLGI